MSAPVFMLFFAAPAFPCPLRAVFGYGTSKIAIAAIFSGFVVRSARSPRDSRPQRLKLEVEEWRSCVAGHHRDAYAKRSGERISTAPTDLVLSLQIECVGTSHSQPEPQCCKGC